LKTRTCTHCFMQMNYMYSSDLPFKNFIYSRYLTSVGARCCKKQIDISFLCVSPFIEDKFRHNIVKVFNLSSKLGLALAALCKWATWTDPLTCLVQFSRARHKHKHKQKKNGFVFLVLMFTFTLFAYVFVFTCAYAYACACAYALVKTSLYGCNTVSRELWWAILFSLLCPETGWNIRVYFNWI